MLFGLLRSVCAPTEISCVHTFVCLIIFPSFPCGVFSYHNHWLCFCVRVLVLSSGVVCCFMRITARSLNVVNFFCSEREREFWSCRKMLLSQLFGKCWSLMLTFLRGNFVCFDCFYCDKGSLMQVCEPVNEDFEAK